MLFINIENTGKLNSLRTSCIITQMMGRKPVLRAIHSVRARVYQRENRLYARQSTLLKLTGIKIVASQRQTNKKIWFNYSFLFSKFMNSLPKYHYQRVILKNRFKCRWDNPCKNNILLMLHKSMATTPIVTVPVLSRHRATCSFYGDVVERLTGMRGDPSSILSSVNNENIYVNWYQSIARNLNPRRKSTPWFEVSPHKCKWNDSMFHKVRTWLL